MHGVLLCTGHNEEDNKCLPSNGDTAAALCPGGSAATPRCCRSHGLSGTVIQTELLEITQSLIDWITESLNHFIWLYISEEQWHCPRGSTSTSVDPVFSAVLCSRPPTAHTSTLASPGCQESISTALPECCCYTRDKAWSRRWPGCNLTLTNNSNHPQINKYTHNPQTTHHISSRTPVWLDNACFFIVFQ